MFEKLKEYCGVFGIYGHPEAAKLTYLGLYALQHRGQESAGIVSSDGKFLYAHREMGLVADVFCEDSLKKLKGKIASRAILDCGGKRKEKRSTPYFHVRAGQYCGCP